jgi:hypothetical protein
VALCQARISTKPLWGFSSSNPYPTQSRAEHTGAVSWFYFIEYNSKHSSTFIILFAIHQSERTIFIF